MKCTFLGTGTSYGVPVLLCDCPVCTSGDQRNVRRRCSLYLEEDGYALLVDTPPDLRDQILRFGVRRIDAVCLTHSHADHVNGFDDLRIFSYKQGMRLPVYASEETIENMKKQFFYVFETHGKGATVPKAEFAAVDAPFEAGPFRVTPFTVPHGFYNAEGFRFEAGGKAVAYVPDCKEIPEPVFDLLRDLDVMILDATTPDPHPTHLSLPESVELLRQIGARRSFVTHLGHAFDFETTQALLPEHVELPYDGLEVTV